MPVGLRPTGFENMDVLGLQNLFSLYDKNGNTEIYTISGYVNTASLGTSSPTEISRYETNGTIKAVGRLMLSTSASFGGMNLNLSASTIPIFVSPNNDQNSIDSVSYNQTVGTMNISATVSIFIIDNVIIIKGQKIPKDSTNVSFAFSWHIHNFSLIKSTKVDC